MIYFDNAATSLIKPKNVILNVQKNIEGFSGNPGRSGHSVSRVAAERIFDTREKIKDFFGAKKYEVIFTKNCSEALNLAIRGSVCPGDHVITTIYEHNSVLRTLKYLETLGVYVDVLDCQMAELKKQIKSRIRPNTKLVITTQCSNVTGEVCDINSIGKMLKDYHVIYLVDGAQGAGHIDTKLDGSGISMYAFAGHKGLQAITGVGGLIVRKDIELKPILFGGTGTFSENLNQPSDIPDGFEVGTIPSISIMSLGDSIDFLKENFNKIQKKERFLSKYLYEQLKIYDFIDLYSNSNSLNVFSFNLKNIDCMRVANELDSKFGICVRSGMHCAPIIHQKIDGGLGSVRVSLDYNNSYDEIDKLIVALTEIYVAELEE